jgi:NDP-sugar pyrophosphorylase family protein
MAQKFSLVMPMAGKGTRFLAAGVNTPKPLIKIGGRQLWQWALASLPLDLIDEIVVVQHADYPIFKAAEDQDLQFYFKAIGLKFRLVVESTPRAGAAKSIWNALASIEVDKPLVVANCDQVYQAKDSQFHPQDVLDGKIDGLIPAFTSIESKWSYITKVDEQGRIAGVVEKPSTPPTPYATVGVYYFRTTALALDAINKMFEANFTVNNEFYFAPCYNYLDKSGLGVGMEFVDKMYGLGTPEDLDVFVATHRYLGFEADWRVRNTYGTAGS